MKKIFNAIARCFIIIFFVAMFMLLFALLIGLGPESVEEQLQRERWEQRYSGNGG